MIRVRSLAPTRVDIGGGTLDITPLHQILDHKATINFGVNLEAQVEISPSDAGKYEIRSEDLRHAVTGSFAEVVATDRLPLIGLLLRALWRPDLPAIAITTKAKSPAGAGLGGSSCLAVALYGALAKARAQVEDFSLVDDHKLVATVQGIETRVIWAPTGCQDYWGAVRGGINIIRYPAGDTDVTSLSPERLTGLGDELILCFSGKSRASATNNWEIFKRAFDRDKAVLRQLNAIGEAAEEIAACVLANDFSGVLAASGREWDLRKQLWPDIVTSETTRLERAALEAGARFARVCGAGGGGVMAIFAPKEAGASVREALTNAGGSVLEATIAAKGLRFES